VIKRIAPVGLILAVACGGGGGDGGTGPNTNPSNISSMAVGEVRVLNPADITSGIEVTAGSGARDYVIIVGNTNGIKDQVAGYVVKADRSTGATFGISAPSDLSAQSNRLVGQIPLARTPQQAVENRVRAFERSRLALRPAPGLFGASRVSARRSAQAAAMVVPNVGDVINVHVPDASTNNLCDNFFQTQAVVASVSSKAILAVDTLDGPPLTLFTPAQMDSITAEFDNVTYPTDAAYFNTPTDFDANSRIIMLFTGQINKLTPPNTTGGFVGGFFFAGDFFPPTDTPQAQGCAGSNQAEIFYLLSPDPTGRFGNVRTASSVRQGTRGTIAHEFQHMINAGNRFVNPNANAFEATWLDEGLAHFAEDAVGRVQRGFGDLESLDFAKLVPCNTPCSQANDFNAFFFQNLARLTYWMQAPDKFSPLSKLADTSLATRGAAWAILRYAADNYSSASPRTFTRALAAGPDTGLKNFTTVAKAPVDTLVKGWLVSMFADDFSPPIAGLNAKYTYASYNMHSVMGPVARSVLGNQNIVYPLTVTPIGSGSDNISATNRSGTGTYYRLTVAAGAGAKNVKILDTSGNPANFSGEHVYVLRIQ
jgi:hypothetical protein